MGSREGNKTSISEIRASSSSIQIPKSLSVAPDFNQSHFESAISSFLSFPDSPTLSISSSFDRVLEKFLSSSSSFDDASVQDQLIDRSLQRVSLLLESTKRCFRKRATIHNSISWFLPPKLTIKVFSMVDTKSLMQVAACCTMFNKCAMDPLCYSHIDLTKAFEHVDHQVLSTMIHRAGKELRALKLGRVASEYFSPLLTSSCLVPHSDHGFSWNLLRSLRLCHHKSVHTESLCSALSACSNLTDLTIFGLNNSSEQVLELLTRKCRLIEHLALGTDFGGINATTDSTIKAFVTNCSNLTSLTLQDFRLNDAMARILVKGFRKLKYMNLSNTCGIDGSFLRDLGHSYKDNPLETLILRDCFSLKEREVLEFLNSLIAGDFEFIRYIDISSYDGLACDGDKRTFDPKLPLEKLREERSDITFVAEFISFHFE